MPPARSVVMMAVLVSAALTSHAQVSSGPASNRELRIDSPRDGAIVAPGETLQVAVSSPNRTRFSSVTVVIEDPIESDREATSLPARFAVKIPEDTNPGSYNVSALGVRANGELVVAVIEIDIERRDMPRALQPRVPRLYVERTGETREIETLAEFGDGRALDVTKSSKLTYESSDTGVATVNTSGTITAVGGGRATVSVWYGPRDGGVKAVIPVEVRQDETGTSPAS